MTKAVLEHLDCMGMKCPMPIVMLSKKMKKMSQGESVTIEADDPAFKADIIAWVRKLGYTLTELEDGPVVKAVVRKLKPDAETVDMEPATCSVGIHPSVADLVRDLVDEAVNERFDSLEEKIMRTLSEALPSERRRVSDRLTLVVFSGSMDKLMAAFIIATGAVAMGMEVSMFFTFWGIAALKKETIFKGKSLTDRMLTAMLPPGPDKLATSNMNMMGLGPAFFKKVMKNRNVESLPALIEQAREMNVRMIVCRMSMEVMGISPEELMDGLEYGGVATFLGDACDSKSSLFI